MKSEMKEYWDDFKQSEELVTKNSKFGIEVSIYKWDGIPQSLLIRPTDWLYGASADPCIEIDFDDIDSFTVLLNAWKQLKYDDMV